MLDISIRGKEMPLSPIRKLTPLTFADEGRGIKGYRLNIGQPDLSTPQCALDALNKVDLNSSIHFRNAKASVVSALER